MCLTGQGEEIKKGNEEERCRCLIAGGQEASLKVLLEESARCSLVIISSCQRQPGELRRVQLEVRREHVANVMICSWLGKIQ